MRDARQGAGGDISLLKSIVGRELARGHGCRETGRPVDHENPLERASEIRFGCDPILDRSIGGSVNRTNKTHRPLFSGQG